MLARKSVKQPFNPDERICFLMETFRRMTNDCIRVGLAEKKTSLKTLSLICYPKLKRYEVPSAYKLCAVSQAAGILKNYRKLSKKHQVREPYCGRPMIITCYGLKRIADRLRIPGGVEITLSAYTQKFLSQSGIEIRSATLTPESTNISVRREVGLVECSGMLGIDGNVENVTVANTDDQLKNYDLSKAIATKAQCRETKRHFRRNDVRVGREVFKKYGRLERDRVNWLLHNVSAAIVLNAKLRKQAIVMEDLKGIRKLYRRGNGQGREYRSRMNSWSYRELQRQIQYKAEWNGLPVIYVYPHGTSAKCSMCGHRVLPEENRMLHCPSCGISVNRDVNAAKNILARGLRFRPVGSASEAMVREPARPEVILKVDADQLAMRRPPTS